MRLTSWSDCYQAGAFFICRVRRLSACGYVMLLPPPKLQAIAPRVFVIGDYVTRGDRFWIGCDSLRCVILELCLVCFPVFGSVDHFRDVDSSEMELCFAISFLGWTGYHEIEYCWIA
ncbi:hypothetical protein F2Q69_00050301 [Brassica cretica]|uniref:Uncharacterized protein n=1 Tax=Brassica cretica TaxID=69181 RepID=A0A8S9Q066_BRACR|nr:hypothetical protein F2Q69_00050301 [Brassica cretica]